MKRCANINCKQANPQSLNSFSKDIYKKDGLRSRCKICYKEYKFSNKEHIKSKMAEWAVKNREKRSKQNSHWYDIDKINILARHKIYRNTHKKETDSQRLKWKKNHPGKYASYSAKRRTQKMKATPPWLTEDQYMKIESLYVEASRLTKETGIPHEVDHIEPLQGKNVKGLHVPWNLRVIPRSVNRRKTNKSIS